MPNDKCIIILSEKSSGSSAFQNFLTKYTDIRHVHRTRHFQNETLYWVKAASILGRPQLKMVNSEVPLKPEKAKTDLIALLRDNLENFEPSEEDEEMIFEGWRALCERYAPVFLEKSPHHLCQWSAIELILQCMCELDTVDFLLVGLIRNPLDTIYSQYKRWRSSPEKVQGQWLVAYQNLLKLKDIVGSNLMIIRYEDMVSSPHCLDPVLDFCGVTLNIADKDYLHSRSLQKWKNDPMFGFALSSETIKLAERYGYHRDELINTQSQLLWPVIRILSHTAYTAAKPIKWFRRIV